MNNNIVYIPLLHNIGEKILMGTPEEPFEYVVTKDFLVDNFPKDSPIFLYSDFHGDIDFADAIQYLSRIDNDSILKSIFHDDKNKTEIGKYLDVYPERNAITISINPEYQERVDKILKCNKVFATMIYIFDDGKIIGIRKIALCLGKFINRILFI